MLNSHLLFKKRLENFLFFSTVNMIYESIGFIFGFDGVKIFIFIKIGSTINSFIKHIFSNNLI